MKELLLIMLLIGVVFISGCNIKILQEVQLGLTNLADVFKNSENYVNKTITISGEYSMTLGGDNILIDEQGYKIKITNCEEKYRELIYGSKYKAKGTLNFFETCECQKRYVANVTEEEWEKLHSQYPQVSKENVSSWNVNYLFMPSPEEGWTTIPVINKLEISNCLKTSLFAKNHTFSVILERNYFGIPINELFIRTEILEEGRCKLNTVEKIYYFKCTEPMIRIS